MGKDIAFNDFLDFMESHFKIEEIKNNFANNVFPNVYIWGMLREYNYHNIIPKLYVFKGAFGNLGYPFNDHGEFIKNNEIINNKTIMIDVAKCSNSCDKIFFNRGISQYIGVIISKKEISLDFLYDKIEPIIKKYFESEYLTFSNEHKEIIISYFNTIFDIGCDILLLGSTLKSENKIFRISKGCNNYKFNRSDLIKIPFLKPYSDHVSWGNKW